MIVFLLPVSLLAFMLMCLILVVFIVFSMALLLHEIWRIGQELARWLRW